MPVRLNGATSGYTELSAPAVAGITTMTMPTASGTLDRLERSGNILQVQQYQRLGVIGSSSSSLAAPSSGAGYVNLMSKSITTTVANSKILVIAEWNSYSSTRGNFRLTRNDSVISGDPYAHYTDTSTEMVNYSTTVVDSPTASAGTTITYSVDVASGSGTCLFGFGDGGGGGSTILALVEIAP
jgi:hypothetical protein